ncbi:MAG: FAD-binding oxidoreductase [Bacteroidetes bacterium]|nr:FAD-binding oxidoreductase [Bacteroidota bacterium]
MTDFILVGRGLAATTLAHTFKNHNISFKIIGLPTLSNCSLIAAGIWNPIVFKRLTQSWLAHKTIPYLNSFYKDCEERLNKKFVYHRNIIKPFSEEQEKQLWLKKSRNELDHFLGEVVDLKSLSLKNYNVSGEGGIVKQSGNIDVASFINATELFFKEHYITEVFDHSLLEHAPDSVTYKGILAKNIIFCEGHLIKNNPFFSWIPMKPAKGEVLLIESMEIELNNHILNKNGFILQTSSGNFKAGATYEWDDFTDKPTEKGKRELIEKLASLVTCPYTITSQQAGVRPSTLDRRPVIGAHPVYSNVYVFNGLGTKGVMLAPYFANNFVFCYLQNQPLNSDVDVKRYYNLLKRAE